jgi:hypothetical protein
LDGYYCPFNLTSKNESLLGTYSSDETRIMYLVVDYCNQTVLDRRNPEENKTCKSIDNINKILGSVIIYFYGMNSYFDPEEFIDSPIKTSVVLKVFTVNEGINNENLYNLRQSNAILYDSYFSSGLSMVNYTYYDF